jgi:hypothetical protein
MTGEQQKFYRIDLNYPAYAILGTARRRCRVGTISISGADLAIDEPGLVPDEFILCLSAHGPPCRKCRVVARMEGAIEIEWLDRVSKAQCEDARCHFACSCPAGQDDEEPASEHL